MKIHILANALDYGDGVSTHCLLLQQFARHLGIEAGLYAEFATGAIAELTTPLSELKNASRDDILLHLLFNESSLMHLAEQFPGRRVLMYCDITPPAFFPEGSEAYLSCSRGLRLISSLVDTYDLATGISEFTRDGLTRLGFANAEEFTLCVDVGLTKAVVPDSQILSEAKHPGVTLLFTGRIAPNKKIEDLVRILAEYRKIDPSSRLILVGNDRQHPEYRQSILDLAQNLGLSVGSNLILTGKVPEAELAAYFQTADAFVCMSEHEGFCAPLIEAMTFGLPVFAYAAGACEQTLGGTGVLFRDKNFRSIATSIHDVIGDKERRRGIVAAQYLRLDDFSWDRQRERLQELVEKVLAIPVPPNRCRPPAVSVVINTCNRGWHLERCLDALQAQTFTNFEVVVVNGPSTDDTVERLKRFENQIRFVSTDSRILSVSRNLGIQNAHGELVAFIDDDAIADVHWLEELTPAFEDPTVGGVGGKVFRMNHGDIEFRNGMIDRLGTVRWDEYLPGFHWHWEEGWLNTVSGNNCCFRRAALEQVGGFDERIEYYHDEADVVMKIERAGFRTLHRPHAIVYHEAARSHNRATPHDLNWFAITKNTLYCALKNYSGTEPKARVALKIVAKLVRQRMNAILGWWRSHEIDASSHFRMQWACVRGIATGIGLGLRGSTRPGKISAPKGPLLRFTQSQRAVLSVGLLTRTLPRSSPGGIATYTMTLARSLRDLGCRVHVIGGSAGETFSPAATFEDGIWFHPVHPAPIAEQLGVDTNLPTVARNLEYSSGVHRTVSDVAARWGLNVIESPNWDAEGLLTAMNGRIPVVVRVHSPLFKVMQTQGWEATRDLRLCCDIEGLLLKHADAVTGSTYAILDLVRSRYPLDPNKTALIPLGLETPEPVSIARPSSSEVRILFVGRLERRKGIHTLLIALPDILQQVPAVTIDIVGRDIDGWTKGWISQHAHLENRVRFHGEVSDEDLHVFYANCDLFVAPSLYESFGLIYLEAMAHGKPVVGTSAGGIPEVVTHGETGILVPPDDPAGLSSAIIKLAGDPDLRNRLGVAGRERYLRCFSPEALGRTTLETYRGVVEARKTAADWVWRGEALGCHRHPETKIVWVPEAGSTCLLAPPGPFRTVWYGPYMALDRGSYRAEFVFWSAPETPPLPDDTLICTVDVFNLEAGQAEEKQIRAGDLRFVAGGIVDIFFSVEAFQKGNYEFRIHSSGRLGLYIREVRVSRWPQAKMPVSSDSQEAHGSDRPLHAQAAQM